MKFRTNSLLTSLVAALASAQIAYAATLVLGVNDNSSIRESQTNQGSSQILFAGDTTTANDYLRSAVAFDLNNPALIGATITSATLTLTVRGSDTSSENATITLNLHELTSSFTNDGVTWSSRNGTDNWTTGGGDFGAALASATGNPRTATSGSTVNFSSAGLASAAQDAIGGTFYLLAKSAVENNTARNLFQFASSRNVINSSPGPVLTIEYIPEPSSALLGGIGLVALLRRRR